MKREVLTHEELFLKLAGDMPKELIFSAGAAGGEVVRRGRRTS